MRYLSLLFFVTVALLALSCTKHTTELIQLDDPVFSPMGGSFSPGQAITITCQEYGASIHYTSDGSEPTEQSPLYSSPLLIPEFFPADSTACTLKARAFKDGFDPSNIVEDDYSVVFFQTVATPIFSPLGGDITTTTDVYIFCGTLNTEIHYTLDGSDPTKASPLYSDHFNITQTGAVTLKAKAWRPNWNPSAVASTSFNVSAK